MRVATIALLLGMSLLAVQCKSSGKGQGDTASQGQNPDLILSFFSPGNGIDGQTYGEVKALLANDYAAVYVNEVPWGREGEKDLCLDMSALSKKERKQCIEALTQVVNSSEKVHVKQDEPCREVRVR